MRETQIIGLTDEAHAFLRKEAKRVPVTECPTCHHKEGGKLVEHVYDYETGVRKGMFEDGPVLSEYQLNDGCRVREVVQAAPWSSGPCIFLCLEDAVSGERMFEWSEEEINEC